MTEVYFYCDECGKDVLVTKIELWMAEYFLEFDLTLECGHEVPERIRLEREL